MRIKKIWQNIIGDDKDSQETEFLPALLEVTETPPSPIGRTILWTIVALLVVAILWSIFGKVDEVAVARGKIIPIGQVKVVQSEDKGIIKKIHVKEGDIVKEGDVLVELDPTVTAADLARLKKQAAYYRLDVERLMAEMNGTSFNPARNSDLEEKDFMTEMELYRSRTAEYSAQKAAAEMRVSQYEAAVQSAVAQKSKNAKLLEIARNREERLHRLVQIESVSQFDYLNEKSKRIEYEMNVQALEEEISKAQAQLSESEKNLADVTAVYQKEVMASMSEARKQLYAYEEELKKAEEKRRLATIVAPCAGRVNQLSVHTVGGIVTEAQAIMMIVPENVVMEAEVWLDNKDIGFVKIGQEAELKIDTFNFQKYGVVDAVVREISPDALDSSQDHEHDKKYRTALTMKQKSMEVGGREVYLSPGMTVTAEIKIKKKRIIEFFLDPFKQYKSEALRER